MFFYVDVLVQVARGWGWDGGGPHWSLTRDQKGKNVLYVFGECPLGLGF